MYFENAGKQNTKETLKLAWEACREFGIDHMVIATHSGSNVDALPEECTGVQIVAVTSAYGYSGPGQNPMSDEKRRELEGKGVKVCTAAHALSGAERSISSTFRGAYPVEIIAHTLRMFGDGTKVCVEIAAMAADAGLIPVDRPVVAVGGSSRGADTAVILHAATTRELLKTRVERIICKPADPRKTKEEPPAWKKQGG